MACGPHRGGAQESGQCGLGGEARPRLSQDIVCVVPPHRSVSTLFSVPSLVWGLHRDCALSMPHEGGVAQMSRGPRRTRPYVPGDVAWVFQSEEAPLPLTGASWTSQGTVLSGEGPVPSGAVSVSGAVSSLSQPAVASSGSLGGEVPGPRLQECGAAPQTGSDRRPGAERRARASAWQRPRSSALSDKPWVQQSPGTASAACELL